MSTRIEKSKTPIFDKLVRVYEHKKVLPDMPLVRGCIQGDKQAECEHERIEQDEPRDGGGAWYRCKECHALMDPDDWENYHGKEWDWWV